MEDHVAGGARDGGKDARGLADVRKETVDARRKVKGAIAELSIVLAFLDKRLER